GADRPRSAGGRDTGRVIVIGPYLRMRRGDPEAQTDYRAMRGSEARLEEAVGLARAIDLTVAEALIAPVGQVRPATYLGKGKVEGGGFGFMGGPGETQIEAERRLIGERITRLENEIKKVQSTRRLHRAGRQRVPYRVVALVGYTNAGKSTLFNRLTRADVQAADMLFATLDPTLRALTLPHGGKAMLSDTVGFISNLPTQLVAAFRATLEEVLEADLILHVRDIS